VTTNGVGYADISQLARQYAKSGVSVKAAAQQTVAELVVSVEDYARQYVPVRTGKLRSSISSYVDGSGMTGVVEANTPYALFVELGTGTRGEMGGQMITIKPKNPNGLLSWTGADGRKHFAKVVHSPGMKSHPYLRPALTSAIDELAGDLAKAVAVTLTKGPKS
jgi:HK97 gp10 family phage protein